MTAKDSVPKPIEKAIAVKAEEALGLLVLMKPLLKRAGRLTTAEQRVMIDTLGAASVLLHETRQAYWDAWQKQDAVSTAVRAS